MLKFIITGQTIKRTDTDKLVQYAQEYPEADFTFDSDWDGLEKTAQWNMADETYDTPIKDGRAVVPWELLRSRGVLNVNVVGVAENKIITTNTVSINVMSCGVIGGMVSGKPSESFYAALKTLIGKHEDYINELENDRKDSFSINDLFATGDIVQKDGISIISDGADNERAVVDIDPETGIRILNNMPKDRDWYIKIGQGDEKGDIQYGIMYRADNGDFWVMCDGIPILRLTPNNSGTKNVINGNETLKINAGNSGYISFDTANAGINYTDATWTEIFKQLDVTLTKGVNMEAQNNSYWWVNAPKKAQYGNSLNKLEFRTDGVAKFSNVVNASDYQIGGKSVKEQLNNVTESVNVLCENNVAAKWLGEKQFYNKATDEEIQYCSYITSEGDYDEDSLWCVGLYIKPNVTYYFNTCYKQANSILTSISYVSRFIIKLQPHTISDIFQIRFFNMAKNDYNGVICTLKKNIDLPVGISWDETSLDGGNLLTIVNGKARLDNVGELSKDTLYPNGIYAARADFVYAMADFKLVDDVADAANTHKIIIGGDELNSREIAKYDHQYSPGYLHYNRLCLNGGYCRYSVVLDDTIVFTEIAFSDEMTVDDYIEVRNIALDVGVDDEQSPIPIFFTFNNSGLEWDTKSPTVSGIYNIVVFNKKIYWEKID